MLCKLCVKLTAMIYLDNYHNKFQNFFFVNRYHSWLFPLVRQFFFAQVQLRKFMDLRTQWFPSCLKQLYWSVFNAWRFVPPKFPVVTSTSEVLSPGTNGSAVWLYECSSKGKSCAAVLISVNSQRGKVNWFNWDTCKLVSLVFELWIHTENVCVTCCREDLQLSISSQQ
jgi:hypothetical protein